MLEHAALALVLGYEYRILSGSRMAGLRLCELSRVFRVIAKMDACLKTKDGCLAVFSGEYYVGQALGIQRFPKSPGSLLELI